MSEQHRPATRHHLSEQLRDLARRVRHLSPCRRDPERYHVEKDEIEATLRRLSQEAGADGARNRPQERLQGVRGFPATTLAAAHSKPAQPTQDARREASAGPRE